jgi:hypothetical protein
MAHTRFMPDSDLTHAKPSIWKTILCMDVWIFRLR